MTRKLLVAIIVGLALTVALHVAMHAANPEMAAAPRETIVYVSPTGSDVAGCGTPALPCAIIGYALSGVGDGAILRVARGTYTETVAVPASVQLQGGYEEVNWLRDIDAYTTTINGNGAGPVVTANGALTATIEGFEITGGLVTAGGSAVDIDSANVMLSHCDVHDNTNSTSGGAVHVTGAAEIYIIDNEVHDNSRVALHLSGPITGTIAGNNIHHNATGLVLSSGAVPLVEYNVISYHSARGAELSTSSRIQHNTISHNSISGYAHGASLYIGGSPTTWVWVPGSPTASAILRAIRAGHVSLSADPTGPLLELRAGRPRQGPEPDGAAMEGDTLPRPADGLLSVRVRCLHGQGTRLRLMDQCAAFLEQTIAEPDAIVAVTLPVRETAYVRAELRGPDGDMQALTNPIYLSSA